ncbi:MAG: DUF2800 domain-containing protein, partial [Mesoflavibacter sp.]|nr:DUF2800 domain-containing protein [Mesoflavibacter sp.]
SDATIVDHEDGTIHVMDYKHGRGVPVEAENNTQLMLYAVGTLVGLHNEGIKLSNFHTVSLHIVQPRCPHPEGPVRIWHTTVKDLQAFSKEAKKAIINACSNDPDFAAGDKQCKWCEFAAMCPTLAKFSLEVAQNEFKDFAIVESDIKDIERLTNEQISGLLQHTKVIEHWIKSLVTYAQNELEQGNSFPDYKLVRGRANRIWDDGAEKKVLEAVKDLEDFDKDALYSVPKFRTPAQIEKELGKQKDIIQKFIVKPLGKITIAHNSDKRASVSPTQGAEDDFAVLADKIDS